MQHALTSFRCRRRLRWEYPWETVALVLLLTAIAFLVRIVNLTSIPTGLHGDEAIVGLEGQRVLREVFIDPYSPSALGQPTAPFYLAALTVWIWDNTVLAVRMSAVIFGTLAIPALFIVVRRSFGIPTALLSAVFLAVMGWHIHFSRIAFPLPAWPLWIMLTAGVLAHAARARSPGWWAAAGVMSALGSYVYNAHTLALLILGLLAAACIFRQSRGEPGVMIRNAVAFGGAALVALTPMLWFILNNFQMYWNSINRHSVRDTAEWQELSGPIAHAGYVIEEYFRYWSELSFSPRVNYVDATGITEIVPVLLLLVALAGMIVALVRFREPLVWLGALIVVLMPFATVLTEQGEMRRTLIIAPFLAMFSAIGIVEAIRLLRDRFSLVIAWSGIVVVAVVMLIGVTSDLRNYFVEHAESPTQHWVFAEDFYEASLFIQGLPDERYVYFMSERWSFDYEPRQFLAPEAKGEDRSDEFGAFRLDVDPTRGDPVFVLVGDYRPALDVLEQEYPGGEVVTGPGESDPAFIAYILPDEVN